MSRVRIALITAGALGAGYYALNAMGDFKTPGVRNIEARHMAAGGGDSHTPATVSKMGDPTTASGNQLKEKHSSSKHFQDNIAEQRPESNQVQKKFNKTMQGNEDGK